jgi:hypothetical protein
VGAATQGNCSEFFVAVLELLPTFEKGENCRVLRTAGPLIHQSLVAPATMFYPSMTPSDILQLQRVVELHDAMLGKAKHAIACWSVVGRRLGVVKDTRVMIAKMVWDEAWRWGGAKERRGSVQEGKERVSELALCC